ncbi:MAG: plasmid mobilization relaxosome protein MobC [Oscillospiraceae bacterium]|nr:plasmid mobilization relaxosome protein MobC [Oscillospiraceae bacterium]
MERNRKFLVRLSDKEMEDLDRCVKKTGMSREGYIRCLLKDKRPVEIPPAPYYDLMREVHALGNNMNQIAHRAHALGMIDAPVYQRNAKKVGELGDRLALVTLPK